jgi:hypothetical protein
MASTFQSRSPFQAANPKRVGPANARDQRPCVGRSENLPSQVPVVFCRGTVPHHEFLSLMVFSVTRLKIRKMNVGVNLVLSQSAN